MPGFFVSFFGGVVGAVPVVDDELGVVVLLLLLPLPLPVEPLDGVLESLPGVVLGVAGIVVGVDGPDIDVLDVLGVDAPGVPVEPALPGSVIEPEFVSGDFGFSGAPPHATSEPITNAARPM